MPLSLGTSFGNARLGISTKWPKGISLGANIPLGVDPVKAKKRNIEYSGSKHQIRNNSINKMVGQAKKQISIHGPVYIMLEYNHLVIYYQVLTHYKKLTLIVKVLHFPDYNYQQNHIRLME